MIRQITISGFKSFGNPGVTIDLSDLNVIVGANASGKSNFLQALEFMSEAVKHGADTAVAKLGGGLQISNTVLREAGEEPRIRIAIKSGQPKNVKFDIRGSSETDESILINIPTFSYEFVLDPGTETKSPRVISEYLEAKIRVNTLPIRKFWLRRDESEVVIRDPFGKKTPKGEIAVERRSIAGQDPAKLAIGGAFFSLPTALIQRLITSWRFYEIDPDVARTPSMESPNLELEKDGSNLAAMLKRLEEPENLDAKRSVEMRMRNIVPGFESWETVKLSFDSKRGFEISEGKSETKYPPRAISAGTIRILTILVIAELAVRNAQVVAIEEPEIGLHPHVMEQVTEVLIEASRKTQIFVTTHNPDFLDFVEPESVILCEEVNGETILHKASDLADIDRFRKNFSLGELWTQGVLGATP